MKKLAIKGKIELEKSIGTSRGREQEQRQQTRSTFVQEQMLNQGIK